ncbi:MAG TPA: hypothetical protein VKB92_11660 [Myxococcales bacterium]|nr:hypothetical protein [Myxococcales bacterium]
MKKTLTLLCACALACGHAPPKPASAPAAPSNAARPRPVLPPPPDDPRDFAAELSEETRTLLRAEGDLLWTRWTTGSGPLPSGALADHPRLFQREAVSAVASAAASARKPADELALRLLHGELATLQVAREAAAEIDALERARAALSFAAPGDARAERGERDLDRLLTDEPNAQKRAAIAQAEAKAAQPLAPLALARDKAVAEALARLGLPGWGDLVAEMHRATPAELADLAERTLAATDAATQKAVAGTAQRNLGVTVDRLRRADLPRLVRSAAADSHFPPGKGWSLAQATLRAVGVDLKKVRVDAEPSPSKAARPLALLVDPPGDVRLSVRPTGGFEEQRAVLHEAARAAGAAATDVHRWELAQLGAGSAAEGVAHLFEELAGDPAWLREQTALRGEPLDDLVHTQATRRLLAARRAAAMVLFEIRRHEGPATAEANASLYRQLLQRATFAGLSDDDAGRWALEADGWLRAATQLQGALLAAQIQQVLEKRPEGAAPAAGSSDGKPAPEAHWWHAAEAGAALRKIWAEGRSGTALDAARALGATELDPAVLAAVANRQLSYNAPEAPPPTQRPDYKYMRGDKKKRRKRKK